MFAMFVDSSTPAYATQQCCRLLLNCQMYEIYEVYYNSQCAYKEMKIPQVQCTRLLLRDNCEH